MKRCEGVVFGASGCAALRSETEHMWGVRAWLPPGCHRDVGRRKILFTVVPRSTNGRSVRESIGSSHARHVTALGAAHRYHTAFPLCVNSD